MERASQDCFTNGGALAEVMTLYENMDIGSPSDPMQSNDLAEHRSQQLVVKVPNTDIYKNCYSYSKLCKVSKPEFLVCLGMHCSLSQHLSCDY